MRRGPVVALLIGVPLIALIVWIGENTYWEDTQVPMPPKGEALTNPFYAAQRFAEALGARTTWDRVLSVPSTDSVVVLSSWHWSLSTGRRLALERWVEAGGRLVVDDSLAGGEEEFERWSGIVWDYPDFDDVDEFTESFADDECRNFEEEYDGRGSSGPSKIRRMICHLDGVSFLRTNGTPAWALRDESGIQAARVNVGRGSVTVINTSPFRERNLFDGDHGWLFVAATEMRSGDYVVFLSEDDHPSLLALMWRHGAPVVVLALVLLALALWRGSIRFGPLAAAPAFARRSLAEQIRGTGQFALRHGSGDALHAASVRALDEAAQRHVSTYSRLSPEERVAVLARLTGSDRGMLTAAVHQTGVRRSHNLRTTIALLESVRRQILINTDRRVRRR